MLVEQTDQTLDRAVSWQQEALTERVGECGAGLCEDLREHVHVLAAFLEQQESATKTTGKN